MDSILLEILRLAFLLALLCVVYLSQRYWFVGAWRLTARLRHPFWRWLLRAAWAAALLALLIPAVTWMAGWPRRLWPRSSTMALVGMWLSSAFLAYVAVKLVKSMEWLWLRARALWIRSAAPAAADPANPSRRCFFQTVTLAAGAVPFVGALYGFFGERLRYSIERVAVPISNLPAALDGLRIVQFSDIHIGSYMPREQVRRAVEMANELEAELAVLTGDLVTSARDPLGACVEELAALRAPLGLWACNGNHEIYAGVEDDVAEMFKRVGARVLRRENAEITWRGQAFNLIGVDYQRTRSVSGQRLALLARVEPLVRRDVPNILLSHNPNAFLRAAELGIELTLAGHTHGGQVQVEILHQRLNPARFFTEFTAGLYRRARGSLPASSHEPRTSAFLYVNRGLGTIGTPVRLGAPPEITLLTLRRA